MLVEFSTATVFQKTFKYKALESYYYFFKGFLKHTSAPFIPDLECSEKTEQIKVNRKFWMERQYK